MDHDLKQCLDAQFQHGMPLPLIQSCMLQVTRTALPHDLACCVTVIATLILNSHRSAALLGPRVLPQSFSFAPRPEATECPHRSKRTGQAGRFWCAMLRVASSSFSLTSALSNRRPGLARAFQARKLYTQEVVTLWYRAPEVGAIAIPMEWPCVLNPPDLLLSNHLSSMFSVASRQP